MILQFVGADHQVTGSAHYLECNGKRFLIDYGMEQGNIAYESKGLPCNEADIDFVILTHAHVDHSGMLPLLYAKGFRGSIFATVATVDLCAIMLRDCAHIQMQEAEWKARKKKRTDSGDEDINPLYSMADADGAIKHLVPIKYNELVKVAEGVEIRFTDIGHLLGSASVEVFLSEDGVHRKMVFSGDIGNKDQPLIKDPEYTDEADYVVMESTYGDRLHEKSASNPVEDLAKIIQETLDRGGNLVIPSFAVGRTQELLYFIRQIKQKEMVKYHDFPVYMDSPLAVDATEIFEKNIYDCFDEEAMAIVKSGINPLTFPGLCLAITSEESKAINFDEEPKVIISASGMCEAGRIRHHLKHNLWRPECTILFVGYQAQGTLGRALLEGVDEVKLFGEPISVRAEIMQLPGMSGHADRDGLIEWLDNFKKKPEKVFMVHGDDMSCEALAEYVNREMKISAYAPFSGTVFDIITGEIKYEAEPEKKKKKITAVSDAFARLLAAGQRLLSVIHKNQGHANKDLAKFTSQIISLADKWDPDADPIIEKPRKGKRKK
ncbi:MAG: MBL fold metallo-hydrolase [Lachnospiraceae bacterium]|nr:MBL fold metallo-hydrolase [Lachnospiraceae bacterium]MBR5992755.1 MBL fold metallo-hydrolase [Lachnospiraceae bacterium]